MKGQALLLAIATILIGSIILLFFYQAHLNKSRQLNDRISLTRAELACEAGAEDLKGLLRSEVPDIHDTVSVINGRPFKDLPDSYSVRVFPHQGYIGFQTIGFSHKKRIKKSGIVKALLPPDLQINLCVNSRKPLIFGPGGYVKGMLVARVDPTFAGGRIEGRIEKRKNPMPAVDTRLFEYEVGELRRILSNPVDFDTEYFTALYLEEGARIMSRSFVNGSVIIDGWNAEGIVLAATARIAIEGKTKLKDVQILSSAPVTITDQVRLLRCEIFAPRVEIAGDVFISGTIIAQELIMAGGRLKDVVIYTGRKGVKVELDIGEIDGSLISPGPGKINLNPGFTFQGLIHSRTPVSVKGTIEGYLFAEELRGEPVGQDPTNHNRLDGKILPYPGDLKIPTIFPGLKGLTLENR